MLHECGCYYSHYREDYVPPMETLVSLGPWWSWFVVQSEQMLRGRGRGEGCPREPALSGLKPP